MKSARKIMSFLLTTLIAFMPFSDGIRDAKASNMYENSDFVETEQPELSEESKRLISLYQKNPTEENYLKLRDNVIENYNAVLDKKEAKLNELRTETAGKPGGEEIVAEMEEIVQEMYITYWSRINSSMLRFTDTRLLKWKISDAAQYEYIPVMGAGESIYVKRTPVTNAEYAAFVTETGASAPSNWTNGSYPVGEDDYPVNFVSFGDALAYCNWLTERDGVNTYRLPNESEWELAAGHMPKDADFNCGVNDGRTPVDQYAGVTRGAHGAIDFWGNVWEWTSTVRDVSGGITALGVKGGSWKSDRTDCRTEYRKEGRDASKGYEDVGFRVFQIRNGIEPERKVELATLDSPVLSAVSESPQSITLSWQSVDRATEYQLFEYFEETGLVQMLGTTKETSVTISGLEEGSSHRYIVQPISYVEIADNVSFENSAAAVCGSAAASSARQPSDTSAPTAKPYEVRSYEVERGESGATVKTVTVYAENPEGLRLYTAVYNSDGTLRGVRVNDIAEAGESTLEVNITAPADGGAKMFLWRGSAPVTTVMPEEQAAEPAVETAETPAALLYQGQGSIRIVTAEEKVIYIDPYAGRGYNLPADLILITHDHPDHNAPDKIKTRNADCAVITQTQAIQNGEHQTFDFGYVKVEAVEAGYNEMHDAAECVGYVLTLSDGKKIYVSGDTSTTPQMSEMAQMRIDYAFYCCDGEFNMGLDEAARCAETVGAKHNIPYHMTGKTPKIYDRNIAEQFSAPNRLIIDAGEEIKII